MNINRCMVLTFATMTLGGCVTVKEVYGPDGRQAHAITCSQAIGVDWGDCFEEAGNLCGTRGYKVWNQSASQSTVVSGTEGSVFGSSSESRTLLISCKDEGAAEQPAVAQQ